MANSNANFVTYHSKNKTFNLFNIFFIIMRKGKRGKKLEKVSFVPLLGLCLDFTLLH